MRVVATAERLLSAASRTTWNLRQFALAPRHRGVEAVIEQGRRLMGPRWRPARLGLIGLVAVQLHRPEPVGLATKKCGAEPA